MRRGNKFRTTQLGATALTGMLAALVAQPALAQEGPQPQPPAAQEDSGRDVVVVTASRRAEDVVDIPYNITAVGSEQLKDTGVKNIQDLAQQIPNLVTTSPGARFAGAQVQVMRGINASGTNRNGLVQEQGPVATYLNNSPFASYFQINDVERVEVLRGPQGTLYGAGALGGAIRIIPVEPQLGVNEGSVSSSIAMIDHSDDFDYSYGGMVNIPVSDVFAVRVNAKHTYTGGYIDQQDAYITAGGSVTGMPVPANPSNLLTSSALMRDIPDVNWSESDDFRVAARFAPTDQLNFVLAYNQSRAHGYGPDQDNVQYVGGVDPVDPRLTHRATDEYEVTLRGSEPWSRASEMTTLDATYDLGFATLSSSSSYFETSGDTWTDGTLGLWAAYPGFLRAYYAGAPANPRFLAQYDYGDDDEVFTQEVRLVSNGEGAFDYILGAYYQKESRKTEWLGYMPGQTLYFTLPGVTIGRFGGGLPPLPGDLAFTSVQTQEFEDKAIFGELTWRVSDKFQITGGVRVFEQTLGSALSNESPAFGISLAVPEKTNTFRKPIFKLNATYEYMPEQRVYATFSQGFRRGGANGFSVISAGDPNPPPLGEPEAISSYKPDRIDNYEIGFKGRIFDSWTYTADVFYAEWKDPQIGTSTPNNFWPVVLNAPAAQSQGFEIEASGELLENLDLSFGYAHTDAKLTEGFCAPVGDAAGGVVPCGISGPEGAPLPASPKDSGTVSLSYRLPIGDDDLRFRINANYKGDSVQGLRSVTTLNQVPLPAYSTYNLNVAWVHGPLTASLFVRNPFDERIKFSQATPGANTLTGGINLNETAQRPRQIGLELTYNW